MVRLPSKPLPRPSLAAALILAGLAATPGLANPQMPPASGPWSSADYVEAIFAVHNGVITLPRQANPKTRAFFDRLIDRGNIEAVMAAPLSAAEKRRDMLIILSATGEFRGRYGYAVALGDDVEGELVAIQIFRLYLIDRLVTLDIQDEAEKTRRSAAIATALFGTLDTLSEAPVFTTDQLLALSAAFARHYPVIRIKLDTREHETILRRLRKMAAQQSDPRLKSALATALATARSGN
ncbi:MAG: hypothetical protein AB7F74_23845 [Parvibaculaceae bacterium]